MTYNSDQQIASRLRRVLEADAFIGDSRELVLEYSKRVGAVNDRLTLASTWLKQGLLAEAIGHAEEWLDAIDAARDLDLGNENFNRLRQRCRETATDVPIIVDRQAAWELSTAYIMHAEAVRPIGRYRAACMAGLPLEERVAGLRDVCLAIARTRQQLGPIGDTVLRTLAGQAQPLVEAALKELAREAGPVVRRISENAATRSPESENAQRDKLLERFSLVDDAVRDINQSSDEVKVDHQGDPSIRYFLKLKDDRDLATVFKDLAPAIRQKNMPAIRAALKSIDRIAERRLVPVPSDHADINAGRALLNEHDLRTNQQPEATERLRALLDDATSTPHEREKAHADLLSILQGPLPDALNKIYIERNTRDEKERRARRVHKIRIGATAGLAALVCLVALFIGWRIDTQARRKLLERAEAFRVQLVQKLDEDDIRGVIVATTRDQEDKDGKLLDLPELADLKKQIFAKIEASQSFRDKLALLEQRVGTETDVADLVRQLEALAPGLGNAASGELAKIATYGRRAADARAEETRRRARSAEINQRVAAADRRADQDPIGALKEYETCMGLWEASVARDLARQVSPEVASELQQTHGDLEIRREELVARIAVLNIAQSRPRSLAAIIAVYDNYLKTKGRRHPAVEASVVAILQNRAAMLAASPALEMTGTLAAAPRPASLSDARARVQACTPEIAGLIPEIDATDLSTLRRYYVAHAELLGSGDPDPLGIAASEQSYTVASWRQLKTVVDVDGLQYYSISGDLKPSGKDFYSLSLAITDNGDLVKRDGKGNPLLQSLKVPELTDMGLATAADAVVAVMRDVKDAKAEHLTTKTERLTANMVAAERLRAVAMPVPLKAKLLRELLTAQARSKWPQSDECSAILKRLDEAGLNDKSRWNPANKDDQATRTANKSLDDWLRSSAVGNLEDAAKRENDRVLQVIRRVASYRLVALVGAVDANAVVWTQANASLPYRGPLFIVAGSGEKPYLHRVGDALEGGVVVWNPGKSPPGGTPIIGKFED